MILRKIAGILNLRRIKMRNKLLHKNPDLLETFEDKLKPKLLELCDFRKNKLVRRDLQTFKYRK